MVQSAENSPSEFYILIPLGPLNVSCWQGKWDFSELILIKPTSCILHTLESIREHIPGALSPGVIFQVSNCVGKDWPWDWEVLVPWQNSLQSK